MATALTKKLCPVKVRNSFPSAKSHTFRVLSLEPETANLPSGAIATAHTEALWPVRVRNSCPIGNTHLSETNLTYSGEHFNFAFESEIEVLRRHTSKCASSKAGGKRRKEEGGKRNDEIYSFYKYKMLPRYLATSEISVT